MSGIVESIVSEIDFREQTIRNRTCLHRLR
jgi:hypothetical protein